MKNQFIVLFALCMLVQTCFGAPASCQFYKDKFPTPVKGFLWGEYLPGDWNIATDANGIPRVDKWFDSSGNGNHLTQPTFVYQPTASASSGEVYFGPALGLLLPTPYSMKYSTASKTTILIELRDPDAYYGAKGVVFGNPYPRLRVDKYTNGKLHVQCATGDGNNNDVDYEASDQPRMFLNTYELIGTYGARLQTTCPGYAPVGGNEEFFGNMTPYSFGAGWHIPYIGYYVYGGGQFIKSLKSFKIYKTVFTNKQQKTIDWRTKPVIPQRGLVGAYYEGNWASSSNVVTWFDSSKNARHVSSINYPTWQPPSIKSDSIGPYLNWIDDGVTYKSPLLSANIPYRPLVSATEGGEFSVVFSGEFKTGLASDGIYQRGVPYEINLSDSDGIGHYQFSGQHQLHRTPMNWTSNRPANSVYQTAEAQRSVKIDLYTTTTTISYIGKSMVADFQNTNLGAVSANATVKLGAGGTDKTYNMRKMRYVFFYNRRLTPQEIIRFAREDYQVSVVNPSR